MPSSPVPAGCVTFICQHINHYLISHCQDLLFMQLHIDLFLFHVDHQYKYQINIDGTVAAYRLPYLLAGDSVVLKQDSGYYEHFYNELRPWEHYIPVRADLGDLLEKIQWARDHDEEVMMMTTMMMIMDIAHYVNAMT